MFKLIPKCQDEFAIRSTDDFVLDITFKEILSDNKEKYIVSNISMTGLNLHTISKKQLWNLFYLNFLLPLYSKE